MNFPYLASPVRYSGSIGREREAILNPYLTCFLASTDYLPTLFDELQIRLGFMNRFIYVVGERKERKPLRTQPLTDEEKKEVRAIEDFLKALAERTSVTMLEMTAEAKQLYDSFEEEIEKRIETEDLGIKEGYYGNLPNLMVRLACLYRISRMTPEEIRNYGKPVLIVEKQDVKRAIDYVWKAWNWFEKVIEMMQTKKRNKISVLPRDQVKELVLEFLSDGKVAKKEEILSYVNNRIVVGGATVSNALDDLVDEQRLYKPKFGHYRCVGHRTKTTT